MAQTEEIGAVSRPETVVRAVIASLFVFAIFVTVTNAMSRQGGAGLIIRSPDDWFNGFRVSMTALLASAIGMLIYRQPFNRPIIIALALGLAFTNLDPGALWESVQKLVVLPPVLKEHGVAGGQPTAEELSRRVAVVNRLGVYFILYMVYVFWTLLIVYSGYVGQFLAGFIVEKGDQRRESAIYVAENAGVGLLTGVVAGLGGIVFAALLSALAIFAPSRTGAPADWAFLDFPGAQAAPWTGAGRGAPGEQPAQKTRRTADAAGPAAVVPAPPEAKAAEKPDAGSVEKPAAKPGEKAEPKPARPDVKAVRAAPAVSTRPPMTATEAGALVVSRQHACTLITALAFFISAYVAGIMLRPRTSTWVACGAIVSLMVLPVIALTFLLPPGALTMLPIADADRRLAGFDARFAAYGRFFHMLEISPFTLAAVAISSALAGDWLARILLLRASSRRTDSFRPL